MLIVAARLRRAAANNAAQPCAASFAGKTISREIISRWLRFNRPGGGKFAFLVFLFLSCGWFPLAPPKKRKITDQSQAGFDLFLTQGRSVKARRVRSQQQHIAINNDNNKFRCIRQRLLCFNSRFSDAAFPHTPAARLQLGAAWRSLAVSNGKLAGERSQRRRQGQRLSSDQ